MESVETSKMLNSTFIRLSTAHLVSRKWTFMMHCGMLPIFVIRVIMLKYFKWGLNLLTSPVFFNMLSVLHYEINYWRYDASKMGRYFLDTLNLGVSYGQGESSKSLVEGEWWNSLILILPITKIFDKIYACNLACGLELVFPYLFCHKNPWKLHVSTIFLAKNRFLPILCVYCQLFLKFRGRAFFHFDIIVTSYEDGWYFLVSMERGVPKLYIERLM